MQLTRNFEQGRASSSAFAVAEAVAQSHRPVSFARLHGGFGEYIPPIERPSPQRVREGNHSTVADCDTATKRFPIEVDGEERMMRLEMRTITVICRGIAFTFSMKAGSPSALDSRDGKRHSLLFIRSELYRLLGASIGASLFRQFTL